MKVSLVLEGGGMRGAYTAGVLTYLLEKDITFDYGVGISAGAMNLCSYWMKNKQYLYDVAVKYMPDKKNVGTYPLFHEGNYVGYKYMFDYLLKDVVQYDLQQLNKTTSNIEIGMYNMESGENEWISKKDLTLPILKAACTLPIAGSPVIINNHHYMDGGIITMIPIGHSINYSGCDKHFVIITKDHDYVRNPEPSFEYGASKLLYGKNYAKLASHFKVRHQCYYQEMDLIKSMVKNKTAYLMQPSSKIAVSRFKGDPVGLKNCFQLGYDDTKQQFEKIKEFMEG